MSRWLLPAIFFSSLLWAPPAGFAQTETEADQARAQKEQKEYAEARRAMERLANSPVPKGPPPGTRERRKFLATVPEFRDATTQFREALSVEPDLRKPIKTLERLIEPLKDYFVALKLKRDPVNLSEFEGLSARDLAWEMLTTAERVDNNLQLATLILQQSQRDGAINIKALEFFGGIQGDLGRLKWLADKVSETGPVSNRR